MISLSMAALGVLLLFFLGRWLFALVLEVLLVPDWRREDFELENCGCVRPGSVEHEMQTEGRGDAGGE
jgi:hypothetical protein